MSKLKDFCIDELVKIILELREENRELIHRKHNAGKEYKEDVSLLLSYIVQKEKLTEDFNDYLALNCAEGNTSCETITMFDALISVLEEDEHYPLTYEDMR